MAAAENFDSQSIGLRAQKKLLSKMSSRKFIGAFIDETSSRLLDNLYKIAKDHTDKHTAEKVIKNLIKSIVKTGMLYRNEQLNSVEIGLANDLRKKFRRIAMTVVSFYTVDFTYDRNFLTSMLNECEKMLKCIVVRHLTDKSICRIEYAFSFFTSPGFMDAVFSRDGLHQQAMNQIIEDLSTLIDNNAV